MAEWVVELGDGNIHIKKMSPLVRCKDCKHHSEKAFRSVDGDVIEYNHCSRWSSEIDINGYCYEGERKDEVEE